MTTLAAPGLLDPNHLVNSFGLLGILLIIFAECGLLIGFFLPGDTLLFVAGLLVSQGSFDVSMPVLAGGVAVAAIVGNLLGYWIGYKAGPVVFNKPDSALFKREHVDRAHVFFEKYGAAAIVLARFVPVVRTFITVMAGASKMRFSVFALYSVIGGAVWGVLVPTLGFYLGKIKFVADNVELILIGAVVVVVFFAILPIAYEYLRRRKAKRAAVSGQPES